MENELFSILEEDAQDRNTHRACLRAVSRAQKQFGAFFKMAASEEDYMARLELVRDRINDVVREACVEEGSASLDTVARVLAGELARTSEVMRENVKDEDVAPSDGEDDQIHVRGIAGRKLLGLDEQEGESKTAAPRRKPTPKMDEGSGRMYQPDKNPPRKKKAPADPNAKDSLDPMKNKNVVVEDGKLTKPKNQQQLDWEKKKDKNKPWSMADDGATNKSLRELEGLAPLRPGELKSDDEAAFLRAQGKTAADDVHYKPLYPGDGDRHSDQPRCQHGYTHCPECFPGEHGGNKAMEKMRDQQHQTPGGSDIHNVGEPGYYSKSAAGATPETGDTYTQERVDLPSAGQDGLSQDPSPKMDKGTAGDENHTSQKPIDIPSAWHSPEVQDVTDTADYVATLEVPGVIDTIKADTPIQPERNVAPNTQAFPNKDQANPVTSKWKVLG